MGYDTSTGIITKPVGVGDLQNAIGSTSTDVGYFCSNESGNVHPWARYKPTRYSFIGLTGKSSSSDWWKADDGKCGFSIPVYDGLGTLSDSNSLAYLLYNGDPMWTYNAPTGGSTSPYRMLDFDGYYNEAQYPVGEVAANVTLNSDNSVDIQFDNLMSDLDTTYNLVFSDISVNGTAVSSMRLGAMLVQGSTTLYGVSTTTIGNVSGTDSYSIHLENMQNYTGRWELCVFITSASSVSETGIYIPGNIKKTTINIIAPTGGFSGSVDGIWDDNFNYINYDIWVQNETSASRTGTFYVNLYDTTGSTLLASHTHTITLGAKAETTESGILSGVSYESALLLKLICDGTTLYETEVQDPLIV